ncbi:hypothetical protein JTB14_021562 [Gonioctena quinquepunctata]|nr:hypothetical protein JTB14_021562 [Gonioctena quinquepunctata]
MDSGYKLKVENPKKKANFVSLLFFWWMVEVVKKGTKAGLEILDLYKALDADKSKFLGDKLEKNWENEIHKAKEKNAKPSLMRALSKTFLLDYMLWGLMFFLQFGVLRVIQPLILSFLISEFTTAKDEYTEKGMYLYSALLILVATLSVFSMHHTNMGLAVIGMRVRIATSTLLYRKITRLNQKSLGDTAAGQVVNLLSNDVTRFDMVVIVLHSLWVLPFQITIITYLLWQEVQISSLAGIISMAIVSLPLQGYLGKITGHIRQLIAGKTDRRVKLMNEVIAGIQVIKMYAWEKSFEKIIKLARSSEIDDITKASYLRGVYNSCMVFLERFALCLTVICYVLLGM